MIKLGQEVKDIVTGFTGIVMSQIEYLNGCKRYGISPKVGKDNKMEEWTYVDEQQLVVISEGILTKIHSETKATKSEVGGPDHDNALARKEKNDRNL
jgi:hypothetical protein